MEKKFRIIISGGGTGGHIFPALAIANALREINPSVELLFIGAEGRMEMEKIPAAGHRIIGLPVVGLQRKITLKNLAFPFKLWKSLRLAKRIIKDFNPHVAVGVGGYASGPTLKVAQKMNIPTLIQEQNSYAGMTNKLLAKKANAICVAYEGMEKFFPQEKIILTGNPVRKGLNNRKDITQQAKEFFQVPTQNKVILVIGGSLGARTINQSILKDIEKISNKSGVSLLWQTGSIYHEEILQSTQDKDYSNIKVLDFINKMDYAFAAANIVISRAGAGTIAELCLVGKPTILVPSPNVSEDHQTKNALALVNNNAALMVADSDAPETLVSTALALLDDEEKQEELKRNIVAMAFHDADKNIAQKVLELAEKRK